MNSIDSERINIEAENQHPLSELAIRARAVVAAASFLVSGCALQGAEMDVPTLAVAQTEDAYVEPSSLLAPGAIVVESRPVVRRLDLGELPELDPSLLELALSSVVEVRSFVPLDDGEEIGYISGAGAIMSSGSILTAAHLATRTERKDYTYIQPCSSISIADQTGESHEVNARAAIYDGDNAWSRYAGEEGVGEPAPERVISTVDMALISTQDRLSGGGLYLSESVPRPGDILYVVTRSNGIDITNTVITPVLVGDEARAGTLSVISGIGESADDDIKPGLSGSVVLNSDAEVVGIVAKGNAEAVSSRDDVLGMYYPSDNETVEVVGVSADREELHDARNGFSIGTVQLVSQADLEVLESGVASQLLNGCDVGQLIASLEPTQ